jgi:hypothetical protein
MVSAGAPLDDAVLPTHVVMQAARRQITEAHIREVLAPPGQLLPASPGRIVAQSLVPLDEPRYVLRVFVDIDRDPPEVVIAYRSNKIAKYWSSS